jgi:Transposase IS200 like
MKQRRWRGRAPNDPQMTQTNAIKDQTPVVEEVVPTDCPQFFGRKDRYPWLDANVRPRMHACLAMICRDAGAEAFRVGGVADNIHLITTLPRTLSEVDPLERLKKKSSKWIMGLAAAYRPSTGSAATAPFR